MFRFVTVFLVWLSFATAAGAQSLEMGQEILSEIDAAWVGSQQTRILLNTEVVIPGRDVKNRRLELLDDGVSRAIVTFMDGPQKGQRVLATDKEVWFFAPRTRRAIRLSPSQRLLGQASVGDVTRLRLSRDYDVVDVATVGDKRLALTLTAKSETATYAGIELVVNPEDGHPLTASYKSRSGKTLKSAEFEQVDRVNGQIRRVVTRIDDPLKSGAYTRITLISETPVDRPARDWTRRALEVGR